MDRHVYAWNGRRRPAGAAGFPVLVVDPAKVASIDPTTHAVTFKPTPQSEQQGAIVDTPAVGDIDDDARWRHERRRSSSAPTRSTRETH